jgi:hypothetical protein
MLSHCIERARIALMAGCGAVLLAIAGCGPPEAGSVKLPEDLKRSGATVYGPASSKGATASLGPGDFQPMPKSAAIKTRSKTSRSPGR